MPFILDNDDCVVTRRPTFGHEEWIQFLPGRCRLARQTLPYLVQLQRQLDGLAEPFGAGWHRLAGIDEHDHYMFIHAVLIVLMASSMNTNDSRWLEDGDLLATLEGLESVDVRDTHCWREQCKMVMAKMIVIVAGLSDSEDRLGFRECLFVPVGARAEGDVRRMAELVDAHNLQTLKDVFYMASGVPTEDDDNDLSGRPREKSSRTDGISLGPNEVLSWASDCMIADSGVCHVGLCDHFTGLLPVVGVPFSTLGEKACLHPSCASDWERECEDRGVV